MNASPLYRIRSNKRFGLIDRSGKIVVAPLFFGLGDVKPDGVVASTDGIKYGVIDQCGEFKIAPTFAVLGSFYSCGLLAASLDGKHHGYINQFGDVVIGFEFLTARHFFEFRAGVTTSSKTPAFINDRGDLVTSLMIDEVRFFQGGRAGVLINNRVGFINPQGELVVSARYDQWGTSNYSEGYVSVADNGLSGLIDEFGTPFLPLSHSGVGSVREGVVLIAEPGGEQWYLNVRSLERSEAFNEGTEYNEGHAIVRRDSTFYVLKNDYQTRAKLACQRVGRFNSGVAVIEVKGKEGLVNFDGERVVSAKYDELTYVSDDVYAFKDGIEIGYIDNSGIEFWRDRDS